MVKKIVTDSVKSSRVIVCGNPKKYEMYDDVCRRVL